MQDNVLLAVAALAGAIVTKLIDALTLRFKTKADEEKEDKYREQELATRLRDELWQELRELKKNVKLLESEINFLREENLKLKAENSRLQTRIEELEGRLRNTEE